MPMLNWPYKFPTDILNYSVDWSRWLDNNDFITSSMWTIPTGITATAQSNDNTTTTIWLSGGTATSYYDCVNTITTSAGETKTAPVRIYVIEVR